jgi:hypothetical protein
MIVASLGTWVALRMSATRAVKEAIVIVAQQVKVASPGARECRHGFMTAL